MTASYQNAGLTTPRSYLTNIDTDLPEFVDGVEDFFSQFEVEPLFDLEQGFRRPATRTASKPSDSVEFTDSSEADFARSLDACKIRWKYKPRTFAVEWDDDGNFVDCFTPNFYLPERRLFIALAASDRRISDNIGRMVRLLRLQHPRIRIELIAGGNVSTLLEMVS